MKRIRLTALFTAIGLFFSGCAAGKRESTVGRDVKIGDVARFVYTYETIDYGAKFLRYDLTVKENEARFSWEKRERPRDYGPATEQDTVAKGEKRLTEAELADFLQLLEGGTVTARKACADSGDSGPWTYLYRAGDDTGEAYAFPTAEALSAK